MELIQVLEPEERRVLHLLGDRRDQRERLGCAPPKDALDAAAECGDLGGESGPDLILRRRMPRGLS
jgi:hypothetical protein